MVIELDAGAMRLILRPERDAERRFSFKSVVEEKHPFIAQAASEKRIPEPPDRFAHPADGEEMINDRHAHMLTPKRRRCKLDSTGWRAAEWFAQSSMWYAEVEEATLALSC